MRLTKKELKEKFGFYPLFCGNSGWVANEGTEKLGQLEDIEEELGIDLVTLFKALKDGIYFKAGDEVYFTNRLELDFEEKVLFEFGEYGDYEIYELNEYGETWALTKEELE